ncbi:AAA family ATPase [Hydrogenophaga sp.]|uniref:AAA family ATPase n=1 Tax=Hydrogenophaga sp. TaxID=1904254 RepID=UPI00286DBE2F|nr:AAA family ATPase [Hydrogenophaga sp.]
MEIKHQVPRWERDFERFLPLKSQFVLSGNVRDLQVVEVQPGIVTAQALHQCVAAALKRAGYAQALLFQPLSGFSVISSPGAAIDGQSALLSELGLASDGAQGRAGAELLASSLSTVVRRQGEPIALIVDFAARLLTRPTDPTAAEHHLFTQALLLSQQVTPRPSGPERKPFYNTVVWIVEKEGDLPDWFIVGNPRLRHVPVPRPDSRLRRSLAPALLKPLAGAAQATPESLKKAQDDFVDGTEGMLLADVNAISVLARVEGVGVEKIADAVRRYKVGVTEDPWLQIDREKIKNAEGFVRQRVKGQSEAVVHMLDIVKRAVTGVGAGRRGGRPRGVAFLAGPTGVGKTELAKTITSLLFGDESAYIRFDMSEFSAEHADQRLLGAPPGYIGYDAGGELTNAIREKPFSVVLFDEIEKAHPRVLDKFLQILDDGVLTSGRGDRVYFSEALIVFTSNLGIYKLTDSGERALNVSPSEPYQAVKQKVEEEIDRHFKFTLNRPEILNRMGENIIVFDFIREDIAEQIFEQMVRSTLEDLKAQDITITMTEEARASLKALCLADLSNGGRGIRNQVEANLLNPLARSLFDADAGPGCSFTIKSLQAGLLTLETGR